MRQALDDAYCRGPHRLAAKGNFADEMHARTRSFWMQKKTIYLPAKQSFAHSSCVPKAPHWERGEYTIVIVTHNMAQARRASDEAIFMLMGELIEHARTEDLFINPKNSKTADYIEGRYG